jgi:short-subunit dehydrogenase
MRERGVGHIVNTASMAGLIANPKLGAYTASKFGVVGLSEVLRAELVRDGVGVSVLCPGLVNTNLSPDMSGGIDPSIVGTLVVQAIEADELYVITHPEHRPLVEKRTERLLAAFHPSQAATVSNASASNSGWFSK